MLGSRIPFTGDYGVESCTAAVIDGNGTVCGLHPFSER